MKMYKHAIFQLTGRADLGTSTDENCRASYFLIKKMPYLTMLDNTDMEILKLLSKNSRMQWQEIGEEVHLTGQAVKNRINRLEKLGVIQGYTIKTNAQLLGKELTAFITVYMKTTNHAAFQKFIQNYALITEANRISGEGCYMLKVIATNQQEIISLLDEILEFGNYKVNLSIGTIKDCS